MAKYPPGSTFKPINGLIGLQEKVIVPSTILAATMDIFLSHAIPIHPRSILKDAIMNSCNSYFCQTYRRILENPRYGSVSEAYEKWRSYLDEFGFGKKLGTEFVNELPGLVPSSSYFDRYHGKGGWKALTVISMAIGQGEVETTPLQMANMTAAIANRGYYYTPHIVKSIGTDKRIKPQFYNKA